MQRTMLTIAVLLLMLPAPARAADNVAAPVTRFDLADGDTLVFLGDSITHQCLYTQYVEDFFYTRYPHMRIGFHNAGVGGDKAADALLRFDRDVASFKPRVVTILLGMNDGEYKHFEHDTFDRYERGMTEVLDRIAAAGALGVPMTPTMFDARPLRTEASRWVKDRPDALSYYSGVLAFYGAWLREQATNRGLGYVDMNSPLNRITFYERAKDPGFTLVADGVHPGENGQVVMAFALLDQMHPDRTVSSVNLRRSDRKWRGNAGRTGKVTEIEGDDNGVRFTFRAKALPWVLPPDARLGYKLTRAGSRLSGERLVVRGLAPGRYRLEIDDAAVGLYTSAQLASGISLQTNERTPQYQQALKVAVVNQERNEKAIKPLRDTWLNVKRNRSTIENDPEKGKKFWAETDARIDELQNLAKEYEDRIYAANEPVARDYELTRVESESLFNGKNLDGWVIENGGQFSVRKGRLHVNKGTGWLRSERDFGDFVLDMDFRFLEKEANSGIFVRTGPTSKNDDNGWPDNGYQVQCMDTIDHKFPLGTMIPYGAPPFVHESDLDTLARAYRRGKWNHYAITCIGEHLTVKLNGRTITTARDIKNLRGHIGIQAELGLLEFRNIRVTELD